MAALHGQPRSFLGLNLTPATVSLVELINRGPRVELATYALADLPPAARPAVLTHQPEATHHLVEFLSQVFEQAGVSGDAAIFSLSTPSVFSTILTLPPIPDNELAAAIYAQARDLVPAALDDMVITATRPGERKHHVPLGRPSQKQPVLLSPRLRQPQSSPPLLTLAPTSRFLIHAIPLRTIAWYGELARALNLELIALEENIFPITRVHPATNSRCALYIHLDNDVVKLYVVSRRAVCLIRTFDLDQATLDHHSASYLAAEIMHALTHCHPPACPQPTQVFLLGPAQPLPDLRQAISSQLACPVTISQPFSGLAYPQGIEQRLSAQGPSFTVAVGLAKREINHL